MEAGFSQTFLWEEVQILRPQELKVFPMAVVPQKNRRGPDHLSIVLPGISQEDQIGSVPNKRKSQRDYRAPRTKRGGQGNW